MQLALVPPLIFLDITCRRAPIPSLHLMLIFFLLLSYMRSKGRGVAHMLLWRFVWTPEGAILFYHSINMRRSYNNPHSSVEGGRRRPKKKKKSSLCRLKQTWSTRTHNTCICSFLSTTLTLAKGDGFPHQSFKTERKEQAGQERPVSRERAGKKEPVCVV